MSNPSTNKPSASSPVPRNLSEGGKDPSKDPHKRLEENLRSLNLTRVLDSYRDHLAQAAKNNVSHLDFLDGVMADEAAARLERRIRRRISCARFPVPKALEGFRWEHPSKIDKAKILALFDLDFIVQRRNVLFIGGTGLGKTHLATALGLAACQRGHSVLFTTAIDLVNHLLAAQSDATFLRKLKAYTQPELLVIDELGYLPIDKHGADLLFQVVSQRYERGSIVLSTNRAPKEWSKVFNDATVASAVLDRLAHHSEILLIEGRSFRTQRDLE